MRFAMVMTVVAGLLAAAPAAAQQAPYQREAREILERVISFRSAQGQGQVPAMATYLRQTLIAGGVPEADIVTIPSGETVAMIVRVPGTDAAARPILFSAHMDVVDARPEDWERSPFQLVEENGYLFGRGVEDNKTGIVSMVSTILRLKADHARPRRTMLFAFVGDEETEFATTRLIAAHPWVRGAEYAINTDAGGGMLSPDGRPMIYLVQAAEKTYATFHLTVTNPGGHSSRPRADNAIYQLAHALERVEAYRFPVQSSPLTTAYFGTLGRIVPGAGGQMMQRFAANPQDAAAAEALSTDPSYVGTLRTTCIATRLDAGHADNALPQRATATVNCRIFPGTEIEAVRARLAEVVADPQVQIETVGSPESGPATDPPAAAMAAITRSVQARAPGVPITVYMESGATDGLIYRKAGIPTIASSGMFVKPDEIFAHGLNERIPTASFYAAIDHIHDLAVTLGGGR